MDEISFESKLKVGKGLVHRYLNLICFVLLFLAVLMDPDLRFEYDLTGIYEIHKYTLRV